MKRLSLLTLTTLIALGCQRSEANPVDPDQSTALENDSSQLVRHTSCYDADEWTCEVEAAIARLTNEKRASVHVEKLEQVFETSYIARAHSISMEHDGLNHERFKERFRTLNQMLPGMGDGYIAENVAFINGNRDDPEQVAAELVKMWWSSTGHRENMQNREFRYIGVGVFRSSNNRIFGTQMFH